MAAEKEHVQPLRIPGKWEWIEEKLRELGEVHLADLAWSFNESMERIYGRTVTDIWELEYGEHESSFQSHDSRITRLHIIRNVASNSEYCVACDVDYVPPQPEEYDRAKGCIMCRLARVHKKCSISNSTFSKIYIPILKELGVYQGT